MSKEVQDVRENLKESSVVIKCKSFDNSSDEELPSYKQPLQNPASAGTKLKISSSKSADSLDSGIYARQKSFDSMDSLGSNESGCNGDGHSDTYPGLSPSDEAIPPLPIQQYEDYLRELQDIRQSIIIRSGEEHAQPISRTDSGEDQDDDIEADWLRMAGLSDLVMASSTMLVSPDDEEAPLQFPTDLSSITVISTLTRPQREAVLKRITSFNRAQKTKKRPKPTISSIFPTVDTSPLSTPDSSEDPSQVQEFPLEKPGNLDLKSLSLPREGGYGDGIYPRRYSESHRSRGSMTPSGNSLTPDGSDYLHSKSEYRTKRRKNLDSIVASNLSGADLLKRLSRDSEYSFNSTDTSHMLDASSDEIALSLIHSHSSHFFDEIDSPFSASLPELSRIDQKYGELPAQVVSAVAEENLCNRKTSSLSLTGRHLKALRDDIPVSDTLCPDFSSNVQNLSLKVQDGEKVKKKKQKPRKSKSLKIRAMSKLRTFLGDDSVFSSNGTTPKDEEARTFVPSAPKQPIIKQKPASKVLASSPRLKSRFSPLATSSFKFQSISDSPVSSRRKSCTPSPPPTPPISRPLAKQSSLRKLSSVSFATLPSRPKRAASYKLSGNHYFQRSRSLRLRSKRPVSLVSLRLSTTNNAQQLDSNGQSIETLSISSTSDTSSWRHNRDEMSIQFTDDSAKMPKSLSYSETAKQESLPNFSLVRDSLGITKISDLSPIDVRKVQSLALIELTALFDLRNIDLKRRKPPKQKYKETCVFGTPLTMLVEWDKKRTNAEDLRVPLVLREIIHFLECNALQDEGILRKSGSAARTKVLRQDLETRFGASSPPKADSQVWADAFPHDVAALLKQFFRELPDPLLSTEYIEAFQSCGLITHRKEQLQALNLLIILLNEVHRDSLKLLLKFLSQVVVNEESNKMSLNNVAMITAPNLFIAARKSKKDTTTTQDLRHAAGTSNIVRMLIKYHKLLWTVPAFMLTQVRHMNAAELDSKKHAHHHKEKGKYKFFQGKKEPVKRAPSIPVIPQPFDYETPKGLMRIQAPNMKLTSIAVQLDETLTASDIIAKYQKQCERMHHTGTDVTCDVTNATHALYEVGGNIHERSLDPDTNMSALLKVNSDASWFIRPRSNG